MWTGPAGEDPGTRGSPRREGPCRAEQERVQTPGFQNADTNGGGVFEAARRMYFPGVKKAEKPHMERRPAAWAARRITPRRRAVCLGTPATRRTF